ncbi:type II toxin-antitoxin system HicA family toxin [Cyanobium sp. BA5m-10]|uniref:type II toxin-antitoxin system HicA family toxin n=1 Tax=Cyanobium sp. BA5m-10 TaxID=2823705 RepID=UPI0020CF6407|nr:type II toxin-antitoxin system HicA family toxin [Cyanobium sp. BA5m-10]
MRDGTAVGISLPRGGQAPEAIWVCFRPPGCRLARDLYQASGQRYTTIPNHSGDIPEGTLRAILRQAGVSVDDFIAP